jgi:hypothetical protein
VVVTVLGALVGCEGVLVADGAIHDQVPAVQTPPKQRQ